MWKKVFALIICFNLSYFYTYSSDCGCDGAAVSGITPIGGTTNIGIIKEKYFRLMTFYKFSYGNTYYQGSEKASQGIVNYYSSNYLAFVLGYGLLKNFTVETEIGGFPDKTQDISGVKYYGSGLSHILLSAKYGLFQDTTNEFEITLGLGGRIPLQTDSNSVPMHIRSSTGAYGLAFQAYFHKGFKESGFHIFFISRTEINSKNKQNYQYGTSFNNSLFFAKNLFENLSGILEIRSENRLTDYSYGEKNPDSGGLILLLSPQINYSINDWNFSALFEYPMYQYYNGFQLGRNFSAALNLTYKFSI